MYRAFLAEIQPQHAIFDLNVERSSLLHVQFLRPRSAQGLADPMTSTVKDCRLLVFLHRECKRKKILELYIAIKLFITLTFICLSAIKITLSDTGSELEAKKMRQ